MSWVGKKIRQLYSGATGAARAVSTLIDPNRSIKDFKLFDANSSIKDSFLDMTKGFTVVGSAVIGLGGRTGLIDKTKTSEATKLITNMNLPKGTDITGLNLPKIGGNIKFGSTAMSGFSLPILIIGGLVLVLLFRPITSLFSTTRRKKR